MTTATKTASDEEKYAKPDTFAVQLKRLSQGDHLPEISTMKGGYRRISTWWLGLVAERIVRLNYELRETRSVLRKLLEQWDSIDELKQVPDEINNNETWQRVRDILES